MSQKSLSQYFPHPPVTDAELIKAIEGYRMQLDTFAHVTSHNLMQLREMLKARAAR
jgi:hypothetical protein